MKQRVLTYGSIVLAFLIAWSYLIFVPHRHKAKQAQTTATETQHRLNEIHQLTLQLPTFLEAQQALESRRLDLNSRLYAGAEILALLDDLTRQADRQRLRVIEITPPVEELLKLNQTPATTESPQFLNLDITLSGEYETLGKFVAVLEQRDYTRGINRCIITGARDGSEPLRMTLGFRALLGSTGGDA